MVERTGGSSENLLLNVGTERKERKDQGWVLELPIPVGALKILAPVVCPPLRGATSGSAEELKKENISLVVHYEGMAEARGAGDQNL